jgi:hypothetical protein
MENNRAGQKQKYNSEEQDDINDRVSDDTLSGEGGVADGHRPEEI